MVEEAAFRVKDCLIDPADDKVRPFQHTPHHGLIPLAVVPSRGIWDSDGHRLVDHTKGDAVAVLPQKSIVVPAVHQHRDSDTFSAALLDPICRQQAAIIERFGTVVMVEQELYRIAFLDDFRHGSLQLRKQIPQIPCTVSNKNPNSQGCQSGKR